MRQAIALPGGGASRAGSDPQTENAEDVEPHLVHQRSDDHARAHERGAPTRCAVPGFHTSAMSGPMKLRKKEIISAVRYSSSTSRRMTSLSPGWRPYQKVMKLAHQK